MHCSSSLFSFENGHVKTSWGKVLIYAYTVSSSSKVFNIPTLFCSGDSIFISFLFEIDGDILILLPRYVFLTYLFNSNLDTFNFLSFSKD